MNLREEIARALSEATAARDEVRAGTLRLVQCAIRDRDIAAHAADRTTGCDNREIAAILATMVRQREESTKRYDEAGRPDLAEREREEMAVIAELLPPPMAESEIRAAAREVVDALSASGLKDVGRCMGALKERFNSRLDMARAGAIVRDMLS